MNDTNTPIPVKCDIQHRGLVRRALVLEKIKDDALICVWVGKHFLGARNLPEIAGAAGTKNDMRMYGTKYMGTTPLIKDA